MTTQAMQMHINPLGRNGPLVTKFALGTMTFGAETNEADAFRQMDIYADHGGNFIDTADVYSAGVSEEFIGRWIAQRGGLSDIILATKGRFFSPAGSRGGSRRAITKAVEASLSRLQVDAIDVYYMHGWDRDTDIAETISTLGDMVHAGKVHNLAWSNVSGWQLQKIIMTADMLGVPRPVAVQPQYNLLDRGIEIELLPCCLENEIAIAPWSPLGGGWLTGKYTADKMPSGKTRLGEDPNRGVEAYDNRNTDKTHAILGKLAEIGEIHNRPMSHVALAWLSARPGVTTLLLGARTVAQLEDNLAASDLVLSTSELAELTKLTAPGLPQYPYQFLADWSELSVWSELGT